jgi:hypothetical protein
MAAAPPGLIEVMLLTPAGVAAIRCYEGGMEKRNRCLVSSKEGR